jgi:hypothetical protein
MKIGDERVIFPLTVTFEDGSSEAYTDEQDLCCNLEEFNSQQDTDCKVVDAEGRKVLLVLELLEVKKLVVE